MSLQIIIYSQLEKVELSEVCLADDGQPNDEKITSFFSNPLFPNHIHGLNSQEFYKCNGKMLAFDAGSKEEYIEFKKHLAVISGFKNLDEALKSDVGFFIELLKFSESEGTIGPAIANKLYLDFSDCEQVAKKYLLTKMNGKFYWDLYNRWHKGLTFAKDNGAVLFA